MKFPCEGSYAIQLTDYSFLPNSLVPMLTHFGIYGTDSIDMIGNHIPLVFVHEIADS